MKIADLSEEKLNYLVAKSLNWQWRYPWLLSEEDYESWQSAEVSEGNRVAPQARQRSRSTRGTDMKTIKVLKPQSWKLVRLGFVMSVALRSGTP